MRFIDWLVRPFSAPGPWRIGALTTLLTLSCGVTAGQAQEVPTIGLGDPMRATVKRLAMDERGERALVALSDGTGVHIDIGAWRSGAPDAWRTISYPADIKAGSSRASAVALSPDGAFAVMGDPGGGTPRLRIVRTDPHGVDFQKGERLDIPSAAQASGVLDLAFSPDGTYLAASIAGAGLAVYRLLPPDPDTPDALPVITRLHPSSNDARKTPPFAIPVSPDRAPATLAFLGAKYEGDWPLLVSGGQNVPQMMLVGEDGLRSHLRLPVSYDSFDLLGIAVEPGLGASRFAIAQRNWTDNHPDALCSTITIHNFRDGRIGQEGRATFDREIAAGLRAEVPDGQSECFNTLAWTLDPERHGGGILHAAGMLDPVFPDPPAPPILTFPGRERARGYGIVRWSVPAPGGGDPVFVGFQGTGIDTVIDLVAARTGLLVGTADPVVAFLGLDGTLDRPDGAPVLYRARRGLDLRSTQSAAEFNANYDLTRVRFRGAGMAVDRHVAVNLRSLHARMTDLSGDEAVGMDEPRPLGLLPEPKRIIEPCGTSGYPLFDHGGAQLMFDCANPSKARDVVRDTAMVRVPGEGLRTVVVSSQYLRLFDPEGRERVAHPIAPQAWGVVTGVIGGKPAAVVAHRDGVLRWWMIGAKEFTELASLYVRPGVRADDDPQAIIWTKKGYYHYTSNAMALRDEVLAIDAANDTAAPAGGGDRQGRFYCPEYVSTLMKTGDPEKARTAARASLKDKRDQGACGAAKLDAAEHWSVRKVSIENWESGDEVTRADGNIPLCLRAVVPLNDGNIWLRVNIGYASTTVLPVPARRRVCIDVPVDPGDRCGKEYTQVEVEALRGDAVTVDTRIASATLSLRFPDPATLVPVDPAVLSECAGRNRALWAIVVADDHYDRAFRDLPSSPLRGAENDARLFMDTICSQYGEAADREKMWTSVNIIAVGVSALSATRCAGVPSHLPRAPKKLADYAEELAERALQLVDDDAYCEKEDLGVDLGMDDAGITVATHRARNLEAAMTMLRCLAFLGKMHESGAPGVDDADDFRLHKRDRIYLYFAGHGTADDDPSYIFADATGASKAKYRMNPVADFFGDMWKSSNMVERPEVLVFFDACNRKGDDTPRKIEVDDDFPSTFYNSLDNSGSNRGGIVLAARRGLLSYENKWAGTDAVHGAFTLALTRMMAGEDAATCGKRRTVDYLDMAASIRSRIDAIVRAGGRDRLYQFPSFLDYEGERGGGFFLGDMRLGRCPA